MSHVWCIVYQSARSVLGPTVVSIHDTKDHAKARLEVLRAVWVKELGNGLSIEKHRLLHG